MGPDSPLDARRLVVLFVGCFGAMVVLGIASIVSDMGMLLPPLGASAFLMFFTPTLPPASPRATVLGHIIGLACGFFALAITGLLHAPSVVVGGVDAPRVLAAAISAALTGVVMVALRCAHPPAGATTLVVSLGIMVTARGALALELGAVLLVPVAYVTHHLNGVAYPRWK